MSRFVKTLALFVAGLQMSTAKAASSEPNSPRLEGGDDMKGVSLQPLNGKFDNLFAGHASHSSHRSHASHSSHYSGSSGYATPYIAPAPAPAPAPTPAPLPSPTPAPAATPEVAPAPRVEQQDLVPNQFSNGPTSGAGKGPSASMESHTSTKASPTDGRSSAASGSTPPETSMTLAEKLRLQIIRVQIRLNSLGLYNGQINGVLDSETRTALKLFQKVKNLPESGQMTTPTLNALGIPAVR